MCHMCHMCVTRHTRPLDTSDVAVLADDVLNRVQLVALVTFC